MTISSPGAGKDGGIIYQDRWEVVLDGMRQMILTGQMAPGSKIRETELAEHFGVSRGPIRESLRALEVAGLVIREPRKSSYVAPVRASDVEEVYSLREAVEVLAIRRALTLHPDTVVRQLQTHLEQFEDAVAMVDQETSRIVEADIHFHDVFYHAADHQRLQSVWQSFNDPLRIMMRLSSQSADPAWRQAKGGHIAISAAAVNGDIEGCVEATRAHLDAAKTLVLEFVNQQERA
ncbi:GntR family transcriptional regulator [soil metagenome]